MATRPRGGEDGFTLVETVTSIAVISIVMMGLTNYFTATTRVNHQEGDKQVAVQVANDAMERIRALKTGAILTGRDELSVKRQWNDPVKAVEPLLSTLTMAYIDELEKVPQSDATDDPDMPAEAALPTTYHPVMLDGLEYRQHWYIGTCYRQVGDEQNCVKQKPAAAGGKEPVPLYRVIVAVTWDTCENECSYVTSTLVTQKTEEPVFNTNNKAAEPDIDNEITALTNDVDTVFTPLQFTASGVDPGDLTWAATNLPTGLSINTSTGLISGTPTAAGPYTARVFAIGPYDQADFLEFTWTIKKLPTMTWSTTAVTANGGVAYTRTLTVADGTSPYKWTATGVPPGLTLNASTGVLSGTPTTVGSYTVTITATDLYNNAASRAYVINVPVLSVKNFTAPTTSKVGTAVTITPAAAGGIQPYGTWTAVNLPAGLSVNSATGVVSGTPTTVKTYTGVVLTVTDASGATASQTIASWKVS